MKRVFQEKDKAVSPIIATILLVAITVVLAATLYTIVGGYTTLIGASTPTASIQVQNASAPSDAYYFIYVQQFGGNISLNDVQIEITLSNNTIIPPITLSGYLNSEKSIGYNLSMKVSGDNYFGATTGIAINSTTSTHSVEPFISQIRFIDVTTNGLIASKTVT
ncbi:MAG: type IV pilin [Candidatus Thermoplasmatota archaeon]|nr:type IV pilin [Candidatus Thermoplasmatota archaeon]